MSQSELLIDAADPHSLAMILPPPLAECVKSLPRALLIQDELTLTTLVAPTDQQKRVKIQFWDEYEAAIKQNRSIFLGNILFGVCTRDYLLEFTRTQRNLAWLISPKPSYHLRVAELIEKGLDCVETILNLVPAGPKQETAIRNLQLSALKMLDMRKYGGYTQRIDQRTVTKDITERPGAEKEVVQSLGEGSIEELEAQVRKLEEQIAAGGNQNGSLLLGGNGSGVASATREIVVDE